VPHQEFVFGAHDSLELQCEIQTIELNSYVGKNIYISPHLERDSKTFTYHSIIEFYRQAIAMSLAA
jgi:hypothetical protein